MKSGVYKQIPPIYFTDVKPNITINDTNNDTIIEKKSDLTFKGVKSVFITDDQEIKDYLYEAEPKIKNKKQFKYDPKRTKDFANTTEY